VRHIDMDTWNRREYFERGERTLVTFSVRFITV